MAVNKLRRILRAASTPCIVRNSSRKSEFCANDPFELFRTWYRDAGLGDSRCAKNMCLTTLSKGNIPKARIIKCIVPTNEGFKFAVSDFSETKADLLENNNVTVIFLWPNRKATRIEGQANQLPEEDRDEYIKNETYHNRIVSICAKYQRLVSGRAALEKLIKELKAKYPTNADIPKHSSVYVLVPRRFEFHHHHEKEGIIRLRFEKGLKIDNKFVHPAEGGWTYSWMNP